MTKAQNYLGEQKAKLIKEKENIKKDLKRIEETRGMRITFKVKGGVQREYIFRYYGLPTKIGLSNKMNL